MRPGQQNKRMRGRNRKGPNPLTRCFESNGGDVKIRGTALHIAEKYVQLARDASSSGDRVAAENYLQHAEHYYRILAAAQAQMPQPQPVMRSDDDGDGDEDGDGFESRRQRFRSGAGAGSGAVRPRAAGLQSGRSAALRQRQWQRAGPALTKASRWRTAVARIAIAAGSAADAGGGHSATGRAANAAKGQARARPARPTRPPQQRPPLRPSTNNASSAVRSYPPADVACRHQQRREREHAGEGAGADRRHGGF